MIARRVPAAWIVVSFFLTQPTWLTAADNKAPYEPKVAAASDEAEHAMAGFRRPEGFRVRLVAAEPLLANPVAFCFDEAGRIYVCETFRQEVAVTDNRSYDDRWVDHDLAAMTVADRIRYHRELLGPAAEEFTRYDDRLRRLEDVDGDGRFEQATVFANGFHQLEDGTGAGVLAYRGHVYYTCIPHLWQLRDTDDDGRADERRSLHYGYGVRVAFRGHDLHGLVLGPDGRLYFSIGDRGYHVETSDGTLADPESGAVFRCNLDGSQLEVYATGLRNPQELAFDEWGNLFTGDNNSDSGDRARWVYVAHGGDSGWRMAYQYLPDRGPFNRERIWHPFHAGQPAYIVPPIANFTDGPSGLAYYPGTGLGAHYEGRFFLCDFRGAPVNSGVRTFRLQPKGAFFELTDPEQTFWNILATDVAFGPDGGVYVLDWVNGWNGEGKGRIYRFDAPDAERDAIEQVRQILTEGLAERSADEVVTLLGHRDQRVRQAAQFELVERQEWERLRDVAQDASRQRLARVHAIWGLEQLLRTKKLNAASQVLVALASDSDEEVRAQAAKMIGESRIVAGGDVLLGRLRDDSPRVQYFAAWALGRIERSDAAEPLLALLAANADQDPIVRHGAIMGLAGGGSVAALVNATEHPSRSARLGAIVALRRLGSPEVARFLNDADVELVVEAARAIHDLPIEAALPQLAARITDAPTDDALLRRVLNANFRLGGAEHADALAAFAARESVPESLRLEALNMLGNWAAPSARDRVLGMWRPLSPRSTDGARAGLAAHLPRILTAGDAVRQRALEVAAELGIREVAPALKNILADASSAASSRASALAALRALGDAEALALAEGLLDDPQPIVRLAALEALASERPEQALPRLAAASNSGELIERQRAYAILGQIKHPAAVEVLKSALARIRTGDLPLDTQLDVIEAAEAQRQPELDELIKQLDAPPAAENPVASYRMALEGGDAERGRRIFFERAEASCVRCHKVQGRGGEVGPDLTEIARTKTREYLLEALVAPNRTIAENFQSVVIADVDGRVHTGVVRNESSEQIELLTAEGALLVIPQDAIEQRSVGKSAMPEDLAEKLTKRDIRDLVEWLSQLK